jgi:hypothetical protein
MIQELKKKMLLLKHLHLRLLPRLILLLPAL